MTLTVEVISDVICPWCYVGKRRLEKAIAALEGSVDVQVRWLPYQLNPLMPNEGMPRRDYRIRKFGSLEHSQELDARIGAVGAAEGIQFAFDLMERTPNTLDAHRLIWLADAGLNRNRAEAMLNGEEGLEAIKELFGRARQVGVDGVPFFIINEKVMLSGAQPPDVFVVAFRKVVGRE